MANRPPPHRLARTLSAFAPAPASGGPQRAAAGELAVIAGGEAATFECCRAAFKAMSSHQFHGGSSGQGLAVKRWGQGWPRTTHHVRGDQSVSTGASLKTCGHGQRGSSATTFAWSFRRRMSSGSKWSFKAS